MICLTMCDDVPIEDLEQRTIVEQMASNFD